MSAPRPADLHASPNALAPHYRRFRVAERLLLTGHSHQAWPDVGFEAQQRAWLDAAEHVDDKWAAAFARADRCRRAWADLLGDRDGDIALAGSTHELVVRLLSALDLRRRPRLVTTDGEFHTVRRQLDRLGEDGVEIVRVAHVPAHAVAERAARCVDGRTAAVLVSAVFYDNAHIVPGLDRIQAACERSGAVLVVDAYHALGAIPFDLGSQGLAGACVVGGGYKYCQLGEGNAFLRTPSGWVPRPVITGWYADFDALDAEPGSTVTYGEGAHRFAGATYDPVSHYRAAAVFDFFAAHGLEPRLLRAVSRHQVALLASAFDDLDLDPALVSRDRETPLASIAGFLALGSPRAADLVAGLRRRGVLADRRGARLRLGPAPYLSDDQLRRAVAALGEAARELEGR